MLAGGMEVCDSFIHLTWGHTEWTEWGEKWVKISGLSNSLGGIIIHQINAGRGIGIGEWILGDGRRE